MLVLTRKPGEEVIIGDGIRVAVVGVQGNKVRLGFTAPEDVPIRREELCFSISEQTEPADAPSQRLPGSGRVNTVVQFQSNRHEGE